MTTTNNVIMHAGEKVMLGGREYILPPMTLATRKKDIETRKAMSGGYDEVSEQELYSTIVFECLKRNYPDLDVAKVEAEAGFAELVDAYAALRDQEARLIAELGKRRAAALAAISAP